MLTYSQWIQNDNVEILFPNQTKWFFSNHIRLLDKFWAIMLDTPKRAKWNMANSNETMSIIVNIPNDRAHTIMANSNTRCSSQIINAHTYGAYACEHASVWGDSPTNLTALIRRRPNHLTPSQFLLRHCHCRSSIVHLRQMSKHTSHLHIRFVRV